MAIWIVQARVVTNEDGYRSAFGVPTFLLDGDIQGIVNEEHAREIAEKVVGGLKRPGDEIHISLALYDVEHGFGMPIEASEDDELNWDNDAELIAAATEVWERGTGIPDGKSARAGTQPEDVDQPQLAAGIREEFDEHTTSLGVALQIALDHLTEDPNYYASKLSAGEGSNLDVANEILRQLGGSGRLQSMIGAKNFIGGPNSLSFRWPGKTAPVPGNKSNAIRIVLDPSDTYNVTFLNIRGSEAKEVSQFDDVYADSLKQLFEQFTGLRLSL